MNPSGCPSPSGTRGATTQGQMRRIGMLESRRSSEGGFLLQAMGLLLIVFTVVGLCMSMQPLEVMGQKQQRAQKEVAQISEAMKKYAADLIRANAVNTTSGAPTNRLQFSLPNHSLAYLWQTPPEGVVFAGGSLQDNSFWKGPYLPKDENQSEQFGFTFDASGNPLDPWGSPYEFIPDISDNGFEIRCKAPSAHGGTFGSTTSMLPVYIQETKERIAILKVALDKYLIALAGLGLDASYDALPGNITVTSPTPAQYCADIDLGFFTALKNGGYIPDDSRLVSDAWGVYFNCYSDPGDAVLSYFPVDFDTAPNKLKKTLAGVRFKYIPTGLESKSYDLNLVPATATD